MRFRVSRATLGLVSLACILAGATGCSEEPIDGYLVPRSYVTAIDGAPDTLSLSGQALVIDAWLGRDFMPTAPSDGRPLSAGVFLRTVTGDSVAVQPADPALFVIYGDEVWVVPAAMRRASAYAPRDGYDIFAGNGPKWGPYVFADVVGTFAADGATWTLAAHEVPIHRSE